jgi:hypothetical protein
MTVVMVMVILMMMVIFMTMIYSHYYMYVRNLYLFTIKLLRKSTNSSLMHVYLKITNYDLIDALGN